MAGFVFRFLTSFVCHLCYVFSRRLCMGNEKLRVKKPFEIITVFGPDNSGKTTLIWNVFNKLLADGGEVTYFHLLGNDANDFHAIVVWKGKIIAICSIGDKADEDCKEVFLFMVFKLKNNKKNLTPEKLDEIFSLMACKGAIKKNQINSLKELTALAEKTYFNLNIRNCPHGRPVILVFNKERLDKRFARK